MCEEGEVAVCELGQSDNKAHLHLVNFTNGIINPGHCDELSIAVYKNKENVSIQKKPPKKIIVIKSNRMQYINAGLESWSSLNPLIPRFQVGVFNRKKRLMKLYNAHMIECQPVLEISSMGDNQNERSYREKMDSLTNTFGSKRKKRAAQSRLKNVTDETHLNQALSVAVEKSNTSQVNVPEAVEESIPPRNSTATCPSEVYKIWDVISQEDYDALEYDANYLNKTDTIELLSDPDNKKYCYYVERQLKFCKNRLNSHNMKLLLYFNYLIMLLNIGYKELRHQDPIPEIPEPIKSNILNKFVVTSNDGSGKLQRSIPARMKDKIMAYCVVLVLHNGGFRIDFGSLQRDFKIGTPKLTRIAHTLGCHVSNKKHNGVDVKFIELKIPLFVPNEKLRRKKIR